MPVLTDSQKWLALLGVAAVGVLLYLLAPVLTPFLVAALLAYVTDPLADRLEKLGLSRTMAVVIVFTGLLALLLLLLLIGVPLLAHQFEILISKLPGYVDWLQYTALPWLQTKLQLDERSLDLDTLKQAIAEHWQTAGGVVAGAMASVTRSGLTLLGWLVNLMLIPVVTFYLLRDWDVLVARIQELLPRTEEPVVTRLARQCDEMLGAFLRGQILVMLALGTIYSIGLWLVGLDVALLIGMAAGLLSFVPYLGFAVGLLAASIAALVQYQDLFHLALVLAVFGVGQMLEGMVLTPWLVGDRIGLHPVMVIFAVMAGGQLFGFFGILLALPVAAVVMVLLRHAHERYMHSRVYDAGNGESP